MPLRPFLVLACLSSLACNGSAEPLICSEEPDPLPDADGGYHAWHEGDRLHLETSFSATSCIGTPEPFAHKTEIILRPYDGPGEYSTADGSASNCETIRDLDHGMEQRNCRSYFDVEVLCDDGDSVLMTATIHDYDPDYEFFVRADLCPPDSREYLSLDPPDPTDAPLNAP